MNKTVRKLKIHGKSQSRAWHTKKIAPWLNVSGLWLDQAGFTIGGSMVEVIVSENQLIIKKSEDGN